jgi:HSP20 family protein
MFDTYKQGIPLRAKPESSAWPLVSPVEPQSPIGESEEGKLSVDVFETKEEVVVIATMAGTKAEDLSLHLLGDLLTIRGERKFPIEDTEVNETHCQECYWGTFSRSIILPVEVRAESVQAEYRSGVLVIRFQKIKSDNAIPIVIIEE